MLRSILIAVSLAAIPGVHAQSGSMEKTAQDWADLVAYAEETTILVEKARNAGRDNIAVVSVIDPYLDVARAENGAFFESFKEAYGDDPGAVNKAIYLGLGLPEEDYAPTAQLWDPLKEDLGLSMSPGTAFQTFNSNMEYLFTTWAQIGRTEFGKAENEVDFVLNRLTDDVPLEEKQARLEAVQARVFQLKDAFGADDPAVRDLLARLEQVIPNLAEIERAQVASRSWPAPFGDFAGPGNPSQLAQTAMDYLERALEVETVMVTQISGDWFVARRNVMGEPIQYALPVQAVLTTENERTKGLARTAEFHLHAAESVQPEKAPPFVEWSGVVGAFNGAQILLEKVPGEGERKVAQP